jgi:hypothetical protein
VSDIPNKNWGLWIIANATCAAWIIYDLSSTVEAPSLALAILQYFLLTLSLIGLVGSIVMYVMQLSRH